MDDNSPIMIDDKGYLRLTLSQIEFKFVNIILKLFKFKLL